MTEGQQFGARGLRGGGWNQPCAVYQLVTFQMDADVGFHDEATGFCCAADIIYHEQEVRQEEGDAG